MIPSLKNKKLFNKYQNLFLILSNSNEGRHILGIKENLPIVKLTPNAFIQDTGERDGLDRVYKGQFFCYEKMAKHLIPYLMAYEILDKKPVGTTEAIELFASQKGLIKSKLFPQIYLTVAPYYTSAGDGAVLNALSATNTWATCRAQTTGDVVYTTEASVSLTAAFPFVNSPYLSRMFFPTDTSGLPNVATIKSASLKIYADSKGNASAFNLAVCPMTAASTTTLVAGDMDTYDSLNSPAEWITRVTGDQATGAYFSLTYNATGLAAISKTGFTYNGMRSSLDIDNSSPANPGTGNLAMAMSESGNDPYLEVNFILGGFFALM